jgi:hypothetical protein
MQPYLSPYRKTCIGCARTRCGLRTVLWDAVAAVKDPHYVTLGKLGAAVLHSRYDGAALTCNARRVFDARFERDVDPAITDPAERARRADHGRRAYFLRLALASAKARRV